MLLVLILTLIPYQAQVKLYLYNTNTNTHDTRAYPGYMLELQVITAGILEEARILLPWLTLKA